MSATLYNQWLIDATNNAKQSALPLLVLSFVDCDDRRDFFGGALVDAVM